LDSLTISSCQAPNMDFFTRDLADYLSERLPVPVKAELDLPWQERDRRLDEGRLDLCWICGLPYVLKAAQPSPRIALFAAPVWQGSRYQDRPIYFSDVVVRRGSPFHSLADLHGASWAYNEPGSHSGYNVVRYALALRGETLAFFGRVVESGAHQASLQMILGGEVDASAIDSTVLEQELLDDPSIALQIRIIDSFGPSPIPPWVASVNTLLPWRLALQEQFLHLHQDPQGQALLAKAHILRFAPVIDRDYDPIREMTRLAERLDPKGFKIL
jgi:phosphonate transport system substrate-binding protein